MAEERKNISGTMTERESLEAFNEGAKQAASAARELGRDNEDAEWEERAKMLDMIRENGTKLANMKAMSRLETLLAANIKQSPLVTN